MPESKKVKTSHKAVFFTIGITLLMISPIFFLKQICFYPVTIPVNSKFRISYLIFLKTLHYLIHKLEIRSHMTYIRVMKI